MRISCASFVRIKSPDGRLALLVDKNQQSQEKTVLVPVGGAMQVTITEGVKIMTRFNLSRRSFDKSPTDVVDLRFVVDDSMVDDIRRVFWMWGDDPGRELYKELVDETGILTQAEFAAARFSLTFAGVGEEEAVSTRTGRSFGQKTLRLVSVFDLSGDSATFAKLEAVGPPLVFATSEEILAGKTEAGIDVASICKLLLAPLPSLD